MTGSDWPTAAAVWSAHLERTHLAEATASKYRSHLHLLAAAMGELSPSDVTSHRLDEWIRAQSWSTTTRAKVLVSLRAFYLFAMDKHWVQKSPVAGVAIAHNTPGPDPISCRNLAWSDAIRDHLAFLRAGGRARSTLRLRRWQLYDLAELHADPWQVTADDLAVWLSRPDVSAEYRRSLRSAARSFYSWAVRTGRSTTNPAQYLDPVRLARALPRPITSDALQEALRKADDRQRLILMLGALAGLRRAEIAAVRLDDIVAGQLLVRGKGGHHRLVPLHPQLAEELNTERARRATGSHGSGWTGDTSASEYLFPGRVHGHLEPAWIGSLATDCLPKGWTLHTLRHRFATQAYASQRDLRATQELLGHARPETTSRYAAVPDGAKLAAVAGVGL